MMNRSVSGKVTAICSAIYLMRDYSAHNQRKAVDSGVKTASSRTANPFLQCTESCKEMRKKFAFRRKSETIAR